MNWDQDITFLSRRINDQSDHIASILKATLPKPHGRSLPYLRAVEIMTSAFKQRFYFEEKLWKRINEVYKVGMKVDFTTNFSGNPWTIGRIYLDDKDCINIESEDRESRINAPLRGATGIVEGIKILK